MIAYVRGKVTEIMPASVVVETAGGVGYEIYADRFSLGRLAQGDEVTMYTHQVIREDEHLLFGFLEKEARFVFEKLISVNGVGPKVAISILSFVPCDKISEAVISQNSAAFESVPGVGKKTAQRLVLELRGKFDDVAFVAASGSGPVSIIEDAASALVSLGYQRSEAMRVLSEVSSLGDTPEDLVRLSLRRLGR